MLKEKIGFPCSWWWPEVLQVLEFPTITRANFPLPNPLLLRRACVHWRPNKMEVGWAAAEGLQVHSQQQWQTQIWVTYMWLGFTSHHQAKRLSSPRTELEGKGTTNKWHIQLRIQFTSTEMKDHPHRTRGNIFQGWNFSDFMAAPQVEPKHRPSLRAHLGKGVENNQHGTSQPWPWGREVLAK